MNTPSVRGVLVGAGAAIAAGLLFFLLLLPLLAMLLRVSPATVIGRLGDPLVIAALRLSVLTSAAATIVVVTLGLPVAYLLATREFPFKRVAEVLVDLPMVLPPTVAGLALLLAFGRAGLTGGALSFLGIELPFTTLGVVVAQSFMAAPFFIGPARAGFASVDRRYVDAASTLRASEFHRFYRIMLPLAWPSLLTGAAMTWARALGEFGATITFAGNLPGTTQTMPLAVYVAMQTDLDAAVTLSVLLIVLAVALLIGLRSARAPAFWRSADARGPAH